MVADVKIWVLSHVSVCAWRLYVGFPASSQSSCQPSHLISLVHKTCSRAALGRESIHLTHHRCYNILLFDSGYATLQAQCQIICQSSKQCHEVLLSNPEATQEVRTLEKFDWLETSSPVKRRGKPPSRPDVRISKTSEASYVTARTSSRPADNDTTTSVNHPSNKSRQPHHTLKKELRRI